MFDTELVKMNVDVKHAEDVWKKAIKLLNGECPTLPKDRECEWCDGKKK